MQSETARTNVDMAPTGRFPLWIVCLGSGLLAGVLAAFGGELIYEKIHVDPEYPATLDSLSGSERSIARAQVRFKTKVVVERNQAMAAYGMLGAALGVILGLTGALVAGSKPVNLAGALVGGVSGGLLGACVSMVLVPVFYDISNSQTGLPLLFLTHLVIFAGLGTAGGQALGWSSGDRKVIVRCMIGGIVGALVGTLVFEVTNFVAFPNLRTFEPVPVKTIPRLIMHLCVAAGAGVFAGRAAGKALRVQVLTTAKR
jgi:hypothetical protein